MKSRLCLVFVFLLSIALISGCSKKEDPPFVTDPINKDNATQTMQPNVPANNAADQSQQSDAPEGLIIDAQPESVSVADGGTATFTVKASGTGTLKYQWQALIGGTWTSFADGGAKTDTLSFKARADLNGRQYRCVVTDSKGSVNSDIATLTVTGDGPAIAQQPTDVSVAAGGTVTFTVKANGNGTLKYQWQAMVNGKWTSFTDSGAKTDTLSFKARADLNGRQYRCVVTDSKGSSYSYPATLTVTG